MKQNPLASELAAIFPDDAPPPVLLGYQQRWIADDSPLKIAEKSRRIGLTWGESADNVLAASSEGGSNVFYISATQDMALEYIEACAMWARAYDLAAAQIEEAIFFDGEKEIKSYRIDFPKTGRRIVALSSRPANLRGKQGLVVIDEAAFAPDLAGLIKAAMAMLMWGDKVHILSTHNGDDNPFNELINEIRAGKRKGSVHRITFNEAVAEGLYRRVCLRKGKAWSQEDEDAWVADVRNFYGSDADEELDVIPAKSGGTYLSLALIEARMAPKPIVRRRWTEEFGLLPEPVRAAEVDAWLREEVAPLLGTLNKELRHGFGTDFARVGDLTIHTVVEEGADLVTRPRLVIEIGNLPFAQQRQVISFLGRGLPRFYSAALDATGNGADLAEHAADEFGHQRVAQIKLNDSFYLENMPRFKAALEDATLDELPQDVQCRDDLRALKKIDGVPKLGKAKTQTADGKKVQRHGDFAISLFLAHYAMKRDVAPIEFTPAPSRASRWDGSDSDDDVSLMAGAGGW